MGPPQIIPFVRSSRLGMWQLSMQRGLTASEHFPYSISVGHQSTTTFLDITTMTFRK